MLYEGNTPQKELNIDQIRFIRSFGYKEGFASEERNGDFWELFYAKKGPVRATTDSALHTLSKSCLYFRAPGDTVTISADGSAPAGLISIGFTCDSSAMDFFRNALLTITPGERRLLHLIIHEAKTEANTAFATDQLILVYLQLLLILLIRNAHSDITLSAVSSTERRQNEDELFQSVVAYMEDNISEHLTIEQICHDNLVGRGILQKVFSDNVGCGIIDYFSLMKINAAKQLIRENKMNFSQIAEELGYNSIHYFSRHFKSITGMTPSDYATGVRHPDC